MFSNIPEEMTFYRQWVVWRLEETDGDKPTKVPYHPSGQHASVSNSDTWVDFSGAVEAMKSGHWTGIGFVLTKNDPYCFWDLDDPFQQNATGGFKYPDPQAIFERQQRVFSEFQTYAELSPSGKGLHLIGKGSIPRGRKREAIEIYSSERFMTMTGNVYRAGPITGGHQEKLDILWQQMGGAAREYEFEGGEQKEEDSEVIDRARSAENGEKFRILLEGDWTSLYSSQSEADFALVDIIAFYTDNRDQIRRIFLNSQLGQRQKAQRRDYQEYMINKSFDRKLRPIDTEGLNIQFAEMLARNNGAGSNHGETPINPAPTPDYSRATMAEPIMSGALPETQPGGSASATRNTYSPPALTVNSANAFPPGLVGEIAQFCFDQSTRPVREAALVAALGLMAGITGRAYQVSGTGLNQYIMFLAPTGTGKDAINGGISKLLHATTGSVESGSIMASQFRGPGEIASSPALIKALQHHPSFVTLWGEIGQKLKIMADERASANDKQLKRLLYEVYSLSDKGKVLAPMVYSDREKNTLTVNSPAFSIIGESVPESFYEALDENMIADGLLPRFTIIEYTGHRVRRNKNAMWAAPSFNLIDMMRTLTGHCAEMITKNDFIDVRLDPEADDLSDQFDEYCDDLVNCSNKEVMRHLWNRAHLKSLKLAALVAVGLNPYTPIIDGATMRWAIDLVTNDARKLSHKFETGEIGSTSNQDEIAQMREICKAAMDWFTNPDTKAHVYGMTPTHISERIILMSALSRRVSQTAAFRKDRRGATEALKKAVAGLITQQVIDRLSRKQHAEMFGNEAEAFVILDPDALNRIAGGV